MAMSDLKKPAPRSGGEWVWTGGWEWSPNSEEILWSKSGGEWRQIDCWPKRSSLPDVRMKDSMARRLKFNPDLTLKVTKAGEKP